MDAIKKISEKVNQLWGEACSILAMKDQIFDVLQAASSRDGQMTAEETRLCYRLARDINEQYIAWYASAWHLVHANLAERKLEFELDYETAKYLLRDIMGPDGQLSRKPLVLFEKCFSVQTGFVRAIPSAIESRAIGLRGILSRDLMDNELAVARHLLDQGYDREAGVIAWVVLEHHLKLLCDKYDEAVGEKDTLGQLNERLKKHYPDAAEYRRVQFLNEIRINCAHDKSAPPDPEKVSQLISGVRGFVTAVT